MLAGALGERAIELLEASAGQQPAAIERVDAIAVTGASAAASGRWHTWIRGRLANRGELQMRLGLNGDIEPAALVASAHAQLGVRACADLRGTFLVAGADRDGDHAFVARDQLGAHPLVYARVGNGAIFAEHERTILDLLPCRPNPDRLALLQWIDRGGVAAGATLYEGITRVDPGHRLVLDRGSLRTEPYWQPAYEEPYASSREELVTELRGAVLGAVRRAAGETRRPALLLSGGLDSACVGAGLAALSSEDAAIAIGSVFPDHGEVDERPLMEAAAAQARLRLELVQHEGASILDPALAHIARWAVPPSSTNLFMRQPLAARAREVGADALIDGEGGDELFGLAPNLIADMLRGGRLARAWALTRQIPGLGERPERRVRVRALQLYGGRPLAPAALLLHRRRRRLERHECPLLERADALALLEREGERERVGPSGPLWWRGLVDVLLGGELLGVANHFAREAVDERLDHRSPLLHDLDLRRFALRIPPHLRFDPIRDRPLLRDAFAGQIPEEIRTRCAKSDFTPVLDAELAREEARLTEPLAGQQEPIRAYLREPALEQLIENRRQPQPATRLGLLWRVAVANAWLTSLEAPVVPLAPRRSAEVEHG